MGDWIETHVVIPDGYRRGNWFMLTDEQWRFVLRFYRVDPDLGELRFYGGQLRRSQKWGKDPLGAALILGEAMGPSRFDGWDANGDPVGAPYPTPYIPVLGVSEDQTDNTYRPLLDMIRLGPLIDLPGMDAGETRTELPNGGTIDPVTSAPKSRLGQRMTFATLTETHLWTQAAGGRKLGAAVKRNIAGMDGRWLELTNAWDPTEDSEAQATGTGGELGVLVDTIESRRVEDLNNDQELRPELLRQYGDSARERGGWVNLDRITAEIRSPRVLESDARRFFLNEIVAGQDILVDPAAWDAKARPQEQLRPGDYIGLGFDGSRSRDSTALIAVRRSDMQVFELGVWEPSLEVEGWVVPRPQVHDRLKDVFAAYRVGRLLGDPWRWENDLSLWAAEYGDEIVIEMPTNVEQRMDRIIHRFITAWDGGRGDLAHDGAAALSRHVKNAVLVKGSRKKARDPDDPESTHYRKLAKRSVGVTEDDDAKIDGAVAMVLALEAAMTMPEIAAPAVPMVAWR
jgi:hypothetical protein